jgi:hypothetical protein
MTLYFHRTEAGRLAESIARNQEIITQLLMEREQIERSLAHHHAELDWLYRCKEYIGGSDDHGPAGAASDGGGPFVERFAALDKAQNTAAGVDGQVRRIERSNDTS